MKAPAGPLVAVTPLRIERRAIRAGTRDARIVVGGYGAARSVRTADELARSTMPDDPIAVLGFGGALDGALAPGELLVADEVRGPDGAMPLASAPLIAHALRRAGLVAKVGPLLSTPRLVRGRARAAARDTGAVAVDMESAWLVSGLAGRPLAVVRAIVDGPELSLGSPAMLTGGVRAYRALRRAAPVLEEWAAACRPRTVLLAGPRSFCAGVDRAIEIVERALDRHGTPVYVRRQIVHNTHVVRDLEARGAVFVEELDEVPDGGLVVLAAHGVAPEVRADAYSRELRVIDATCPLVNKVHVEARRFARDGYRIVLVGHSDHEEVQGTLGEAPHAIDVVEHPADVDRLQPPDPQRVAFLTQTTLALDEVQEVVDRLRERFPAVVGPSADDVCYATQNRQEAVRALAGECDLLLVVGSRNSSNSNRLVEVAQRQGCASHLVEDASEIELSWLRDASTVGITAGASAPESLVRGVVDTLASLGSVTVREREVVHESVHFALPAEVR